MSSIRTSEARQAAIDRMMTVMQAEYSNEISAIKPANLPMPAPKARDYYEVFVPPDEAMANSSDRGIVVYFTNESPRSKNATGSAGPSGHYEKRTMNIGVTAIFRAHNFTKTQLQRTDANGNDVRPLQMDEVQRLRAEHYLGAMDEVIRKYAPDGDNIHDIELVDDISTTFGTDQEEYFGPFGVGAAIFQIMQQTQAPNIQALP